MPFPTRLPFFPYWVAYLMGGGLVGLALAFVNWPWAVLAGALAGCGVGFLSFALTKSDNIRALRTIGRQSGFPPDLEKDLEGFEKDKNPLAAVLNAVLSMKKDAAQETHPLPSRSENASSREALEEEWRSFFRELETLNQTIHLFRDVIRDWASNIEKAGRINKSLLQLNELIVSDSKKVAQDTDEAARSATDGIKSVGKEIKAMTDLKATIGSSTEVIRQLSLASDQIGDFLATITTIARKTNLLALNAGIEAARAGEHGQGFAVVASEIKTLAEASAKASGDVKTLVDDIRNKTASAISLISTTGKIEENVNVVYSAGDVFMNIVKSIRKAGGLLGEISQALEDQRNDNELLLQLINRIYMAGDQVRDRFAMVEENLGRIQKQSSQLKGSGSHARKAEAS